MALFLLNHAVALALYGIKGIPLMEDDAWVSALGSGFLLFVVNGALPFLAFVVARLLGRKGRGAILASYVLSVLVGGALAYGAYTAMTDLP